MNKTLCIILARGGSKRLPGKNIKMLDGKPLLIHTVDAAMGMFNYVIVSSDSQEILDVVCKYRGAGMTPSSLDADGCIHPTSLILEHRPEHLATDKSKAIDTVRYYFEAYDSWNDTKWDTITLMLPTCPLRTKEHVKGALKKLDDKTDSVISYTDYEFPITLGLEVDNGFITEHNKNCPFSNDDTRSQDHKPVYRPNGAIYAARWESFREHQNFFKGKVRGYYMPRESSIDVDTELDFLVCETLLKARRGKENE